MPRHRAISLMLILVSSIFAVRFYLLAPWYLDRTAFLLRPLAFVALPLFAVGCILWIRPPTRWPRLIFPLLLIAFGIIGICFQGNWPSRNLPISWEDSYETLGVLEALFWVLGIPMWICCGFCIGLGLGKPSSGNKRTIAL